MPTERMRAAPRRPRLFLNRIPGLDWLVALEYGRVDDGQPTEHWRWIGEQFAYLHAGDTTEPGRRPRCLGFRIVDLAEFDPGSAELRRIWRGARFDAPLLGLENASAGEIAVAARAHFGDAGSINRFFFEQATRLEGEEALNMWRACLESGDSMAHFGLGYTLLDLGEPHRAYRHLRHYCEIAPAGAWNHCWFGRAAEAIGELGEALRAYETAIELSEADDETDAPERREELARRIGS